MKWNDRTEVVIEDFRPSSYVMKALSGEISSELVFQ